MKKIKGLRWSLFLGFLWSVSFCYGQGAETQVRVFGIRSGNGNVVLTFFKNKEGFEKRQAFKKMVFDKKTISSGHLTLAFKIEPGVYGITLLDDENGNGKMDKNFIGMPKEGFGFSNFYMERWKRPTFDDFKVNLTAAENTVEVKVKYM